jgi:hypothetical protein
MTGSAHAIDTYSAAARTPNQGVGWPVRIEGLVGTFDAGSWGAAEQETGVSQRSSSQNSYFLRETGEYEAMGTFLFAKVLCKS